MPYGLIAFDFDGTLADSFGAFVDALNAAAAKHGFHRLEGARLAQARGASARDVMRLLDVPLWKAPAITLEMRQQMRERIIAQTLSLIHISEPTRQRCVSRMPSSA